MKKPQAKAMTTVAKWIGIVLIVFIIALITIYPLSDEMRDTIDETVRAKLLQDGKAQQFVKTSFGTMHVRVTGPKDGPVVLLVHGGVVGGYAYNNWQEPLARSGYRVIVPDLLGYGYSDRPDVPYTKEFYVTQLNELLDGLGIEKPVNIIGASQGGGIAIAFAAAHTERIKSIGLMAPEGGGNDGKRVNELLLNPVIGDWAFRVVGPKVLQRMMAEAYENSPARGGMLAWMEEQSRYRGFGEGVLNSVRNSLVNHELSWQPDALDAIGRSGTPVIAIWGTNDTTVPFSHSEELKRRIPQLQLVPLEGLGHAINFGREANTFSFLLPFLDKANN